MKKIILLLGFIFGAISFVGCSSDNLYTNAKTLKTNFENAEYNVEQYSYINDLDNIKHI